MMNEENIVAEMGNVWIWEAELLGIGLVFEY